MYCWQSVEASEIVGFVWWGRLAHAVHHLPARSLYQSVCLFCISPFFWCSDDAMMTQCVFVCVCDFQLRSLAIHRRFYMALAMHDLVQERPLLSVCSKYHCNKGQLQSLMQSAAKFAGLFSRCHMHCITHALNHTLLVTDVELWEVCSLRLD